MDLQNIYTLSSAHITNETWDWLHKQAVEPPRTSFPGVVVYPKEHYGFFICIVEHLELLRESVPKDLVKLAQMIPDSDNYWLMIDVDGPIVDWLDVLSGD